MARLFGDIQTKLLCVLLAIGLWFFVSQLRKENYRPGESEMSTLRIVDVPVQLEGVHATRVTAEPSDVAITVQWRRKDALPGEALSRIYAVIPAKTADTERIYSLTTQDFVLPPGWLLVEVTPSKINLTPLKHGEDE